MKQPHFLIKVTVVASSVLLVAALVCYRAGAFDGFIGGGQPGRSAKIVVDTSPQSNHVKDSNNNLESLFRSADVSNDDPPQTLLIGGTKSAAMIEFPRRYLTLREMFDLRNPEWNKQSEATQPRSNQTTTREAAR